MKAALEKNGYAMVATAISDGLTSDLLASVFNFERAGQRCLLDHPAMRRTAEETRDILVAHHLLPRGAVAIQAIAFDKNPDANWKVPWHQDLMFPLAERPHAPGYDLATEKDGVPFARPPRQVLERLLAVRLHLDDCGADNGPLRVSPGSHIFGIIPASEVAATVVHCGEVTCVATRGDALLMRPLALHASSPAKVPSHRRVAHLVYYDGPSTPVPWHRAV